MKKREENLMAKIAKLVNVDAEELKQTVKESRGDLYTYEEDAYQRQAVINFFKSYVMPEEPRQKQGESKVAFAKRKSDYEAAKSEWKFRICEGCKREFVYAYHYDGVSHCSLDCLDTSLRKIGLQVTVGRDLKKRWGNSHPAIVPAEALNEIRVLYGLSSSSSGVPFLLSHPKPQGDCVEEHTSSTLPEQDNPEGNTA